MELNGVANLKLILNTMVEDYPYEDERLVEVARAYNQVDLLERYMIAYQAWVNRGAGGTGEESPAWHEVVANPKAFPNTRELEAARKRAV